MHSDYPIMLPMTFSLVLLFPPLVSAGLVAKPGRRCGNLSIPYPYGVGPGCSLDPSFDIRCDASTGSPRAYITIIDKEVVEINETYVRVKYPNYVASACYGLSGFETYSTAVNLSGTQYTLSRENWLTAIGCDDMVAGSKQVGGNTVSSSCVALCAERNDTGGTGYCPDNGLRSVLGNGCCRGPVDGGSR